MSTHPSQAAILIRQLQAVPRGLCCALPAASGEGQRSKRRVNEDTTGISTIPTV